MDPGNIKFTNRRHFVALVSAVILLVVSIGIYTNRGNNYELPKPSNTHVSVVTNPYALLYWMPQNIYDFTLDRINDYLEQNNASGSILTVVDNNVMVGNYGSFSFELQAQPGKEIYKVVETTENIGGILSYSVTVNGKLQSAVPLSNSNGTSFTDFGNLVSAGVSAAQVNELQAVLLKFAPLAKNIAVDTSRLTSRARDAQGLYAANFGITIDSTYYMATLKYSGLTVIELSLNSSQNKPVFDSGLIDSSR